MPKPIRDVSWLRFVRSLPCCVCSSRSGIEAAHVGNAGMSQKADDTKTVPLCRAHHRTGPSSFHKLGRRDFERVHSIDLNAIVRHLTAKCTVSIESGKFVGRCEDGSEYMLGDATHENRLDALNQLRRLRAEDLRTSVLRKAEAS